MKASFERMRAARAAREAARAKAEGAAADMQSAEKDDYRAALIAVSQTAGRVLDNFKKEVDANSTVERGSHQACPYVRLNFGPVMTVGGLLVQAHVFGVSVARDWKTFHASTQLKGRPMTITAKTTDLTAQWVAAELEKAYTAALAL